MLLGRRDIHDLLGCSRRSSSGHVAFRAHWNAALCITAKLDNRCPLWVRSGAGDWAQPLGHVRNTPQSRRSFKLRLPPQRSAGLRRRGDRCNGMVLCPKAQAGNLASARPQLGALRSSRQLAATLAATLAAASKCEATAPLRWSRDHEQDSATRHISTCELAFADEMIA